MSTIRSIREDVFSTIQEGIVGRVKIVKSVIATTDPSSQRFIELYIGEQPWMNNVVAEDNSHRELYDTARGSVLLAGLGLGCDVILLRDKPSVTSIRVVEINGDVISLVGPQVSGGKVTIEQGDILSWTTIQRYDTIFFDILLDDVDLYPTSKAAMEVVAVRSRAVGGSTLYWRHPTRVQVE
jgi:hypothetical protein